MFIYPCVLSSPALLLTRTLVLADFLRAPPFYRYIIYYTLYVYTKYWYNKFNRCVCIYRIHIKEHMNIWIYALYSMHIGLFMFHCLDPGSRVAWLSLSQMWYNMETFKRKLVFSILDAFQVCRDWKPLQQDRKQRLKLKPNAKLQLIQGQRYRRGDTTQHYLYVYKDLTSLQWVRFDQPLKFCS